MQKSGIRIHTCVCVCVYVDGMVAGFGLQLN